MAKTTFILTLLLNFICTSCQVKETTPAGDMVSNHSPVTNKFTLRAPSTRTFSTGDTITFVLTFPFDIEVDSTAGDPRIELDIGGISQYAVLVPQGNPRQLHFSYVISPGEFDNDGIDLLVLDLDGSTLKFTYLGTTYDCDVTSVTRRNFSGLKVDTLLSP